MMEKKKESVVESEKVGILSKYGMIQSGIKRKWCV